LEGLEIAEVNLAQLEFSGRLDSEYYRPKHLLAEELLLRRNGVTLKSLCDFLIGPFGSAFTVENYTDIQVYRYIRGKDVKPMTLAEDDNVYMPKTDFERLSKYALSAGDVLVSVVGTLGNSALVESRHIPAIFSCKSTALRPYNLDSRYLVTYLNCKYGRDLLMRKERGAIQKGLNLDDLKTLLVYVPGPELREAVAIIHATATNLREQTKIYYLEAEKVLLSTLGIDNWQAPEPLTYVRNSSEVFAAGRLDAEHYQEKFYAAKRTLKSTVAKRFIPISELLVSLTNGHTPLRHDLTIGEVPFLCAEHVTDFNLAYESDKRILLEHHENELSRTAICNGDVLLTIKGRIGNAAIAENVPGAVNINQDVALLRFNDVLPIWFVVAYLNSRFGKLQSEKMATGAINPFLGLFSIRQFEIPEFSLEVMNQIAKETKANVHAARQAKQRASQLLEAAKRAVEIAIEQSEAEALTYLETIATTEGTYPWSSGSSAPAPTANANKNSFRETALT
jgi:type I restriction enzyme S subunit